MQELETGMKNQINTIVYPFPFRHNYFNSDVITQQPDPDQLRQKPISHDRYLTLLRSPRPV
jgi:hypothetical protein